MVTLLDNLISKIWFVPLTFRCHAVKRRRISDTFNAMICVPFIQLFNLLTFSKDSGHPPDYQIQSVLDVTVLVCLVVFLVVLNDREIALKYVIQSTLFNISFVMWNCLHIHVWISNHINSLFILLRSQCCRQKK